MRRSEAGDVDVVFEDAWCDRANVDVQMVGQRRFESLPVGQHRAPLHPNDRVNVEGVRTDLLVTALESQATALPALELPLGQRELADLLGGVAPPDLDRVRPVHELPPDFSG